MPYSRSKLFWRHRRNWRAERQGRVRERTVGDGDEGLAGGRVEGRGSLGAVQYGLDWLAPFPLMRLRLHSCLKIAAGRRAPAAGRL